MTNPSDPIVSMDARAIPWPRFRAELQALYEPPMAARATLTKLRQILAEVEALGIEATDGLTPELVARFIASRPDRSPYTVRSLLMSLRTVCSYAEKNRYVVISPFRLRKLSKWVQVPPLAGKRHFTRQEIGRVLALMQRDIQVKRGWAQWRARRLYALTATAAYGGMRSGEARRLYVTDLDLERRVIHILPHESSLKTPGSAQPIAMPPALVPILRDWLAHRLDHPADWTIPPPERIPWLFPGTRRVSAWDGGPPQLRPVQRLRDVAERAGVPGMTFQGLRRSWCTIAEGIGMPQAQISRQARHSSEETTKRWYQQRDMDALRDAVDHFPEF